MIERRFGDLWQQLQGTFTQFPAGRVWTVAEAKARLSEVLRLAEQEGPQRIGVRKSFVVVPAELWRANSQPAKPLGQWLVDTIPRGANLDAPDRREPARGIPFIDDSVGAATP